jgi:hypothetical protein
MFIAFCVLLDPACVPSLSADVMCTSCTSPGLCVPPGECGSPGPLILTAPYALLLSPAWP